MKYNRVFTFGCSWTRYLWPMWADMFRYTDQAPLVYNWGKPGMGNVGIFYRMIECDLKNKFTDSDLIIVQWSSWTREDRYMDKWETYGNVFNSPFYDKAFTKKYWSWNNDVIKNSSCIIAANKMFNIDYQFNMTPFAKNEYEDPFGPELGKLNKSWHATYTNALPTIDTFPNHLNTYFNGITQDSHPDIKLGLLFFNEYIKDKFEFTLEKHESNILAVYDAISSRSDMPASRDGIQKLMINEMQKVGLAWSINKEGWT
jgi:hypothetical protein